MYGQKLGDKVMDFGEPMYHRDRLKFKEHLIGGFILFLVYLRIRIDETLISNDIPIIATEGFDSVWSAVFAASIFAFLIVFFLSRAQEDLSAMFRDVFSPESFRLTVFKPYAYCVFAICVLEFLLMLIYGTRTWTG